MANDDSLMSQEEIERLFSQTKGAPSTSGLAEHPGTGAASPPTPEASGGVPSTPGPGRGHIPIVDGKDDPTLTQDGIERLLSEAGRRPGVPGTAPAVSSPAKAAATGAPGTPGRPSPGTGYSGSPDIAEQDIEYLLAQAEKALESVNSGRLGEVPSGVSSYRFNEFSPAAPSMEAATLDLIRDVELDLKIELGRTQMYLEDVLKLRKGAVVPLDKLAGDPVDIYVNGRLIARGEVLVLNDNFCVRVAELIVGANVFS